MAHYKLQPTRSETFCRLIPTIMFIIAITTVVLTMFFMFVLQSRNAYELDGDDENHFSVDNDDFKMEIDGATSDQLANLDIDDISFEGDINVITTPQPTTEPPHQQFETFLLKKTINPTSSTNNHIKTNSNMRTTMKAYKIVSKEPIIENSLVKIVMAPHNVLEQLTPSDRDNVKNAIDTIDKSGGNVPINEHRADDIYDRKLIQNGNGIVNVEDFSLDDDHNDGITTTIHPEHIVRLHNLNNIQVIGKSHKQPFHIISIDRKIPTELKEVKKEKVKENRVGSENVNDVEIKSLEDIKVLTTTEPTVINTSYTDAEELISNPTTSQKNLIPTLILEDIKSSEEHKISMEMNDEKFQSNHGTFGYSPMTSLESSAESNNPLVVLKILKNRTVLVEETKSASQSIPDQFVVETTSIQNALPPSSVRPKKISRPTKTTTTTTTTTAPEMDDYMDSWNQYENNLSKLDDVSFDTTTKTSSSEVEATQEASRFETLSKAKNMKRAIGDERPFSNKIVRPSPLTPKKFGDFLPRETDAERAERLSKSMQRLMHFVTIVGHVDSYLTKRVRTGLKNVAKIFDSMEQEHTRRRRNHS